MSEIIAGIVIEVRRLARAGQLHLFRSLLVFAIAIGSLGYIAAYAAPSGTEPLRMVGASDANNQISIVFRVWHMLALFLVAPVLIVTTIVSERRSGRLALLGCSAMSRHGIFLMILSSKLLLIGMLTLAPLPIHALLLSFGGVEVMELMRFYSFWLAVLGVILFGIVLSVSSTNLLFGTFFVGMGFALAMLIWFKDITMIMIAYFFAYMIMYEARRWTHGDERWYRRGQMNFDKEEKDLDGAERNHPACFQNHWLLWKELYFPRLTFTTEIKLLGVCCFAVVMVLLCKLGFSKARVEAVSLLGVVFFWAMTSGGRSAKAWNGEAADGMRELLLSLPITLHQLLLTKFAGYFLCASAIYLPFVFLLLSLVGMLFGQFSLLLPVMLLMQLAAYFAFCHWLSLRYQQVFLSRLVQMTLLLLVPFGIFANRAIFWMQGWIDSGDVLSLTMTIGINPAMIWYVLGGFTPLKYWSLPMCWVWLLGSLIYLGVAVLFYGLAYRTLRRQ